MDIQSSASTGVEKQKLISQKGPNLIVEMMKFSLMIRLVTPVNKHREMKLKKRLIGHLLTD